MITCKIPPAYNKVHLWALSKPISDCDFRWAVWTSKVSVDIFKCLIKFLNYKFQCSLLVWRMQLKAEQKK